jgi:hypothetical protein
MYCVCTCTTLWKRETRRQTVKDVRTRTGPRGSAAGDRLQGVRGWEMMGARGNAGSWTKGWMDC